MSPKLKILIAGFVIGVASAVHPYDWASAAVVCIGVLIGLDGWLKCTAWPPTR